LIFKSLFAKVGFNLPNTTQNSLPVFSVFDPLGQAAADTAVDIGLALPQFGLYVIFQKIEMFDVDCPEYFTTAAYLNIVFYFGISPEMLTLVSTRTQFLVAAMGAGKGRTGHFDGFTAVGTSHDSVIKKIPELFSLVFKSHFARSVCLNFNTS
jgi:hypothetical protein